MKRSHCWILLGISIEVLSEGLLFVEDTQVEKSVLDLSDWLRWYEVSLSEAIADIESSYYHMNTQNCKYF